MYKGFYNLTSAMLTHQHNLNVIGNNLVNISTSGYKQERYVATTFDDVMYSRVDVNHSGGTEIGRQSYIRAASDSYTDYSQGIPEPTELALDFAIVGSWASFASRITRPWSGTTGGSSPERAPSRVRTSKSGTSIWSAPTAT